MFNLIYFNKPFFFELSIKFKMPFQNIHPSLANHGKKLLFLKVWRDVVKPKGAVIQEDPVGHIFDAPASLGIKKIF